MSEIIRLLDEYERLCDSTENGRRLSLWEAADCGLRGETQWHGIPNYTSDSGRPMPVTAECLEKMWEAVLGMDLRRFYTEPDYFLEFFLKYKILKFRRLADDTPLTREIPVCFGVTHEAGMLGQGARCCPACALGPACSRRAGRRGLVMRAGLVAYRSDADDGLLAPLPDRRQDGRKGQ